MPSSPVTREELIAHLDPIKSDVQEIVTLLREQNSAISDTKTEVAVLKDRQPTRQAMAWGAGAGSFVAALGMLLDYLRFHSK
jgi:homoserine dehydrogenase